MASLRDAQIVVLGGAGFLGSHLCHRLLSDGARRVTAIDDLSTGARKNVEALEREGRFLLVRHDITTPISHSGVVDVVFNLASPASPPDYDTLWLETMRVNALGTQHGLELAQARGAVFVQASTSEIYGDPLVHPQTENDFGNVDCTGPRAVYDEGKRFAEALVQAFSRKRGVAVRVARIFNTYGPRMRVRDGRVVPQFISQALRGEELTVYGDGSQTRSLCYVSDLVDGLVKLALSTETRPVNLGNPQERTVLQIAEAVLRATGSHSKVTFAPLPEGDPRQRRPDITRAQTLLGWAPRVSLEDGLATMVEAFRLR